MFKYILLTLFFILLVRFLFKKRKKKSNNTIEWKVKSDSGLFTNEINPDGLAPADRKNFWDAELKKQAYQRSA